MPKSQTKLDDIMPSAATSDDELRRWHALPPSVRQQRLAEAIEQGFASGISTRSIDDIIADAHARVAKTGNG
jgi:hypothetical protein